MQPLLCHSAGKGQSWFILQALYSDIWPLVPLLSNSFEKIYLDPLGVLVKEWKKGRWGNPWSPRDLILPEIKKKQADSYWLRVRISASGEEHSNNWWEEKKWLLADMIKEGFLEEVVYPLSAQYAFGHTRCIL